MAPTSEERREVAERLRDAAELTGEGILAALIDIFGTNFNFVGNVTLWRSTMTRLADLIDPTCRVVIPNEMDGECFCSECGALVGEYGYTSYCPECGARVTDGGER